MEIITESIFSHCSQQFCTSSSCFIRIFETLFLDIEDGLSFSVDVGFAVIKAYVHSTIFEKITNFTVSRNQLTILI